MATPKYARELIDSVHDCVKLGQDTKIETTKLAIIMESMVKHMDKMQDQLDEHTAHSNLAHQKYDQLKTEVNEMKDEEGLISENLSHVCKYVDDQIKEKEIREKIGEEEQKKKDKKMKSLRQIGIIIGIMLSSYGMFELIKPALIMLIGGGQ